MHGSKPSSGSVFVRERTCDICLFKFYNDTTFENHFAGWVHQKRLAIQNGRASVANDPPATVGLAREEVESAEQQAQTIRLPPLRSLLPGQASTLDSTATAIVVPAVVPAVNLVPPTNLVPPVTVSSPVTIPSVTIPSSVTTPSFEPPGPAASPKRPKTTKSETVRCDDCQMEFSNVGALEVHCKSKKHRRKGKNVLRGCTKIVYFPCELCSRIFINESALEKHLLEKPRTCTVCWDVFDSESELQNHLVKEHRSEQDKSDIKTTKETVKEPGSMASNRIAAWEEWGKWGAQKPDNSVIKTTKETLKRPGKKASNRIAAGEAREAWQSKPIIAEQQAKISETNSEKWRTEVVRKQAKSTIKTMNETAKGPIVNSVRCGDCQREFADVEALKQHRQMRKILYRYPPKVVLFPCELCSQIFMNDSAFKKHLLEKPQTCMCWVVFENESALQSHLVKGHRNEQDKFAIDTMNDTAKGLESHSIHCGDGQNVGAPERHHESKEHQPKVVSNAGTNSKKWLTELGFFPCELCSRIFMNDSALKNHLLEKPRTCTVCWVVFDSESTLQNHLVKGHRSEQDKSAKGPEVHSVYCDDCQREFLNVGVLEQHRKGKKHQKKLTSNAKISETNSEKRRIEVVGFPWEPCSQIFMNYYALKKHMLEKPRTCPLCQVVSDNESALQNHLNEHQSKQAKSVIKMMKEIVIELKGHGSEQDKSAIKTTKETVKGPGKHGKHGKHEKHGKHGKHRKHGKHGKHRKHGKHGKHGKHRKHGKHWKAWEARKAWKAWEAWKAWKEWQAWKARKAWKAWEARHAKISKTNSEKWRTEVVRKKGKSAIKTTNKTAKGLEGHGVRCGDCQRKFLNVGALEQHRKSKHQKKLASNAKISETNSEKWRTEVVIKQDKSAIKTTNETAKGLVGHSVRCGDCQKKFLNVGALEQHRKSKHQ